ncbi:sulfatase [Psychromonas ossibalaenae]|uniref:sulfatase n=1 Tax=Psychromonas ossibalaenae TaxID=444922 RepID=UPI000375AE7C|nr:sulfatase [Psychromonas ossibalaenae]
MKKSNKLSSAIKAGLLASCMLAPQAFSMEKAVANQVQPNIVLFLVDDLGWSDTSLQFARERVPSNDFFRTPNIENMAKTGVKFTQSYAAAVCSPTRTSIMTGQNTARHKVTNWIMLAEGDHSGTWGPNAAPADWRLEGIQPQDVTLPKQLQMNGYHTVHIGKAHFGALNTEGADPLKMGFDVNVAGHAAGAPASYYGEENFGNDMPVIDGYPQGVPGLSEYHGKDVHLTDVLTWRAEEEIDKAAATGKPFFINMSYYAVHTPIEAHPRFIGNYENRPYKGTNIDIPLVEERYASLVEGTDDSIGNILEHLKEKGLAENTLVIFTSDNGGLSAHTRETTPRGTERNTHNYPLRSGKGSAYEGGSRVPYVASWAKIDSTSKLQQELPIKPNSTSKQPLMIEDLFPTILSVAKATAKLPEDYIVDGIDATKYWVNSELKESREMVTHYPHVWGPFGPGYEPHSTLILDGWKVIYFYNSNTWELYNIDKDIGESFNLAAKEPSILNKLALKLKNNLNEKGAQWPVNRMTGKEEPLRTPSL